MVFGTKLTFGRASTLGWNGELHMLCVYSTVSGMMRFQGKLSKTDDPPRIQVLHQNLGFFQLVEAVPTIYLIQQLISPQITHRDEVDGALRSLDRTVHVSSSSMLLARKTSPGHGMFYVSDKEGAFHCQ